MYKIMLVVLGKITRLIIFLLSLLSLLCHVVSSSVGLLPLLLSFFLPARERKRKKTGG